MLISDVNIKSCIVHLAGRTEVSAWFHLISFSNDLIGKCNEAPNDTIHEKR
jgi:hypothetical protein